MNLWHVFTRPAKGRSDNDKESETKHWVCKVFVTAVGGLSQREYWSREEMENPKEFDKIST